MPVLLLLLWVVYLRLHFLINIQSNLCSFTYTFGTSKLNLGLNPILEIPSETCSNSGLVAPGTYHAIATNAPMYRYIDLVCCIYFKISLAFCALFKKTRWVVLLGYLHIRLELYQGCILYSSWTTAMFYHKTVRL